MISTEQLKKNYEKVYIYTDESGNSLYCKVREKGKKNFWQFTCVSSERGMDYWQTGVNCKQTIYNLPAVEQARRTGKPLFFVEGEKDTETLKELGLLAVTSGSTSSWKEEFAEEFKGLKAVICLPDNDKPGKDFMKQAAKDIIRAGTRVKIINLPGLGEKEDVTDWFKYGNIEDFKKLVQDTKWYEPGIEFNGGEIEAIRDFSVQELLNKVFPPVQWFIEDILPEGLTVFVGSPKIGKSWFALNAFFSIANGSKCLSHKETKQAGVAYFALEDNERRLQDRIKMIAQADPDFKIPDNAKIARNIRKLEEGGLEQIYGYIEKNPEIKLIIIDTLQRVRKPTRGGNAYEVDTELLSKLHKIYLDKGISILVIHHVKKGSSSDWIEDISGSQGIAGVCDTIIALKKNRFEQEGVLYVTGRDIKEDQELTISFNSITYNWELIGHSEIKGMSAIQREIIDILRESEKPLTNKDIAALTGKDYNRIRKITKKMEAKSYVVNSGNNNNNKYILSSSFNYDFFMDNEDKGINEVNGVNGVNDLPSPIVPPLSLSLSNEKTSDIAIANSIDPIVPIVSLKVNEEENLLIENGKNHDCPHANEKKNVLIEKINEEFISEKNILPETVLHTTNVETKNEEFNFIANKEMKTVFVEPVTTMDNRGVLYYYEEEIKKGTVQQNLALIKSITDEIKNKKNPEGGWLERKKESRAFVANIADKKR